MSSQNSIAVVAPQSPRDRAAAKARVRANKRRRAVRTATVTVRCDIDFLGMGEMYAYVDEVRGIANDLKLVIHDAVQTALSPSFDATGSPVATVDWQILNQHLPRFLWGKVLVKYANI